ncbi:MAG: carboxypeptidase-like regulatory domain-containing protein [Bacteroidaceae bacterium]|nr:carboxypeptidase-like regulatory domain-containing protein [Bacteroidaceae bacterium]
MRRHIATIAMLLTLGIAAAGQELSDMERTLDEVTVKPRRERYRRKGNPAVELMRRVIAAKGDHDPELNAFFSYHKYQRMTFAVNNITQRLVDSLKVLQHPLAKRQVEFCPQTGRYILPFAYNEKATDHIYRREPRQSRDFVVATNAEGLTEMIPQGDAVTDVVRSVFADVNIMDDDIVVLERKFTSPLSRRAAISFFQFFIQDTTVVEGDSVIRVNFVPQNPQDFGFSGRMNIFADGTYRVQQCTLNLPLRSSVNFINNLVLTQRFADLPNGQRVLASDDFFAEMALLRNRRTFMAHRATTYTALSIDSIPEQRFQRSDQRREGTTNVEDDAFWAAIRPTPLTPGEANLRATTTHLRLRARRSPWMYILRTLVFNYAETHIDREQSRFDIGPVMSTISSNFIDGCRLRLGGQTTARLHPHLFAKGFVAYGTRSHRWYGMAELEYSFLRKQYVPVEFPRHSIAVRFQDDVASPADLMWTDGRDKDNAWTSLRWQSVRHMMFMRSWQARYELETNNHLTVRLDWRNQRITPAGDMRFTDAATGQPLPHLYTADITAALRWAPGEQVTNTRQRRRAINHNTPVFSVAHTVGLKGVSGCRYAYNLTELAASHRLWLNSYGRIDMSLRAGAQWNRVPFPLLITPVANQSYIIQRDMFALIGNLEFLNDRYVSLGLEWDLSGKLFNRIPLLKRLHLREVVGFRALYGHLTDKNTPTHAYLGAASHDAADEGLMLFPQTDGQTIVHPMGNTPYMELNVGIHNILKCIRIDYVRRLNYHFPGTKRNGVRFGLYFNF